MMDTDDKHMEEMEMDRDFSDETQQPLTEGEGPSSWRRVGEGSRPSLQWTKSFPPYSQCIGGLGHWDSELNPDSSTPHQHRPTHSEILKEDWTEAFKGTERKDDGQVNPSSTVKSRTRRSGGSYEDDAGRWERGRWVGKRRVEGGERGCENVKRVGGARREWKHRRGRNSSFETEERDEERKRLSVSVKEGEKESVEEEAEEQPGGGGSPAHQWSSPHPLLSKLLHSSSSTSSCSINLSSVEDDVFSEGEDDGKKKTVRKCHSWKTYLTIMHWSLRRQSSWVQLAGHQGNFQLSPEGEVLKLHNEEEAKCLERLMEDPLRPFVPQFHGTVTRGEHCYIRLEDLLSGLRKPVIMDCKMGVRTYREEELVKAQTKPTLRSDMYQKMVKIDPAALSAEEHTQKGVTKWRYLQWRDTTTSTSTLGFRIEGIMMEDGSVQRDFRKRMTLAQVTEALLYFTTNKVDVLKAYHSRLLALSDVLMNSPFFRTHEVIGSSLLFVHDHSSKASVWMIDFGKTTPVQDTIKLRHNIPWVEGSREDGYLIGLTSLIDSLGQAISMASCQEEESILMKQTEECG